MDHQLFKRALIGLAAVGIVFAGLLLLIVLVSGIVHANAATSSTATSNSALASSDTPNVVTSGLSTVTSQAGSGLSSAGKTIQSSIKPLGNGLARGSVAAISGTGRGLAAAGRGIGSAIYVAGRTTSRGLATIISLPIAVSSGLTNTKLAATLIRPVDHNPVPVIDSNSPALAAAQKSLPGSQPTADGQVIAAAQWPLHGEITTEFGVPELPYQAVHTGLDISDGKAPGVSAVHAYRSGTVITVTSIGGLGNHVVIDHGNGVTSVYGHLNSFAVKVGQRVTTGDVIGMEGTTGVSTGPHVHFEIRVNGQATDPHQFINGQPYL